MVKFQWISPPIDMQGPHPHVLRRRTDDYVDYCSLAKNFRAMVMVPHGNVPWPEAPEAEVGWKELNRWMG